ncbi:MAG: hypothetical protein JO332_20590 [Planctomycetaceae bacterium]|nr:hypothetical protein [Planctomycetaceae bacterium]
MSGRKEWMLGIPGHNELVTLDAVLLLVRGGQLRPTDLVKKLGEPWRAANEVSDLASHFNDVPGQAVPKPIESAPPKPAEPPRSSEPLRSTTDRVPRSMGGKTPDSSKSFPKITAATAAPARTEEKAPEPAPRSAEDRAPIRSITSRIPPASTPKATAPPAATATAAPAVKEEVKLETKRAPLSADADKTDKISNRKLATKRELPKPPVRPEPTIEPMAGKYYSPVDMLRCASFAFEPKKLWSAWPVVFLVAMWKIGMYASEMRGGAGELPLSALFTALLVVGLSFMLTALAYVSRRQLEGRDYYFGEMIHYAVKSLKTVIVYPALSLVPSLVCVGILFLMRLARNKSPGMASALKVGYIVPMIFAIVAVLGALVYQVASMYVPAAGAVEGEGTQASLNHAWNYVRRQWGRVVLHWLIVTVAVGVIATVFVALAAFAVKLPELIFGRSDDVAVMDAWSQFEGIQAVYHGVAYGLGMVLPVSLFSTLGMLSYLALRHPAGAQLNPSSMDDTSGIAIGAQRGARSPMESTNPSDTRPAPADASPPLSDISDDSDEQPLVKD